MAVKKPARKTPPPSGIARRRAAAKSIGNPDYAKRRTEVLDAAATVFRQKGYHAARLAEVSALLGGDRATIYYYFSGKRDLFLALVTEPVLQNTLLAESIRDSGADPLDRIRLIVRSTVLSFEKYPGVSVSALEDPRTVDTEPEFAELRGLNSRYIAALRAIIDDAIAAKAVTMTSGLAATLMIMGALNWVSRWFQPGHEMTGEELADWVVKFVIGGLTSRRR